MSERNETLTETGSNSWQTAWAVGLAAAKHHRNPALVLWLFGVALVATYFYVPAIHNGLEWVGRVKTEYGLWFSAFSTAVFGGLLPVLVTHRRNLASKRSELVSSSLFWGLKGIEIDWLYRVQAMWFGSHLDAATILAKTAVDQVIYVPIFGLLNVMLFYRWRAAGYRWTEFRRGLGWQWYKQRVGPTLISNWFVWIPAVALIYSLPLALQLPVQNLILCFWVLLLQFFTERDTLPTGETSGGQPPISE